MPLHEVRRFVDACRPIFASVKRKPAQPAAPAGNKEKPADVDKEGNVRVGEMRPTDVRSADGIPFPTRPAPGDEGGEPSPEPDKSAT